MGKWIFQQRRLFNFPHRRDAAAGMVSHYGTHFLQTHLHDISHKLCVTVKIQKKEKHPLSQTGDHHHFEGQVNQNAAVVLNKYNVGLRFPLLLKLLTVSSHVFF